MENSITVEVTVSLTMKVSAEATLEQLFAHAKDHPGDLLLAAEKCIKSTQEDAGWVDDNTPAYVEDVLHTDAISITQVRK